MAAQPKQKLKLIYLLQILESSTDPNHGLTMPEIIERLEEKGIHAERKSVYRDLATLREAGYNVVKLPTRPVEYAYERPNFSLDDVMILIDAVQSSCFLTDRKSNQLVKTLKSLVSEREQKQLARRVHVQGRIKSQSDSIYHSVDILHEALARKLKVAFLYFSYGTDLARRARHEGKRYVLTPVRIVYSDSKYYLAAYDDEDGKIKTYRVDRMELLQLTSERATRNEEIANYEYKDFAYRSFGMFNGQPMCVTLHVQAAFMDAIVDRFGVDVEVAASTRESADVRVNVRKSPQFFGWVAGLDGGVTIKAPGKLVDEYHSWLRSLIG